MSAGGMRLCGETVTVFNGRPDPETGGRRYRGTVLTGVSWHGTRAADPDARGGLSAADGVTLRIPEGVDAGGKRWIDPAGYRDATDAEGLWTLDAGDVIVKGAAEGEGWTPARLRATFCDCAVIAEVTDNRRAPNAPHWRVTGR